MAAEAIISERVASYDQIVRASWIGKESTRSGILGLAFIVHSGLACFTRGCFSIFLRVMSLGRFH